MEKTVTELVCDLESSSRQLGLEGGQTAGRRFCYFADTKGVSAVGSETEREARLSR